MAEMTELVVGTICALWRYPVKSMRGERVEESMVTDAGMVGDRAYAVVDAGSSERAFCANVSARPRSSATNSVHPDVTASISAKPSSA